MNSLFKLLVSGAVLFVSCCQQQPTQEPRTSIVQLPIDNIHVDILKSDKPVIELKDYSSTTLVINSNRLFQQNDSIFKRVSFQKYSSSVISTILSKISSYPKDTKIDIKAYKYGSFGSDYLKTISEIQAQTIAALLWDYGNTNSTQITYKGLGNTTPKIANDGSFSAISQNNRIEITLS
ncbi:MAG: hypothetical protein HON55_01170 [Legionellales bacterium]|jgi:outer membrane protein OmpA-like peptidoglycan-associated protein|nr:hypothetical protein [Legionellales bacterium]